MIRVFLLLMFFASQAVAAEPTIQPKDTIILKVAGIPKDDAETINNGNYLVDESGGISLPYLGKVAIGGLTADGAAHLIENKYVSGGNFTHPAIIVSIKNMDPLVAEVWVSGPVQHPGKYRMKIPATIEQAFVLAGGWSGSGELGIPAKFCLLTQHIDGKSVHTHVRVRIDRKTKRITVLDQAWRDYHLADGDRINLAEVYS